jgi:urea transport system permease protein
MARTSSSRSAPEDSRISSIWTAVGGRGTLIGPIIGAFLVNGSKSWFTQAVPEYWLFFLGLLFVLVTLFLPRGVIALFDRIRPRARGADEGAPATPPSPPTGAASAPVAAGTTEGRA